MQKLGLKLKTGQSNYEVLRWIETSRDGNLTLLWIQQLQTNPNNPNNKPGIIIHDNEKLTCVLVDVAIFRDGKVIERVVIKINVIIHQMHVTVLN
jgi:hypothetical protein